MSASTAFMHGSVTNKYASNGKHYVECTLVAENQDGELSAHGTAVAQLPSKTDDRSYCPHQATAIAVKRSHEGDTHGT